MADFDDDPILVGQQADKMMNDHLILSDMLDALRSDRQITTSDIVTLESICPGIMTDISLAFDDTESKQLALESIFDNKKLLLAGALGLVIGWILKYIFKSRSDDSDFTATSSSATAEKKDKENRTAFTRTMNDLDDAVHEMRDRDGNQITRIMEMVSAWNLANGENAMTDEDASKIIEELPTSYQTESGDKRHVTTSSIIRISKYLRNLMKFGKDHMGMTDDDVKHTLSTYTRILEFCRSGEYQSKITKTFVDQNKGKIGEIFGGGDWSNQSASLTKFMQQMEQSSEARRRYYETNLKLIKDREHGDVDYTQFVSKLASPPSDDTAAAIAYASDSSVTNDSPQSVIFLTALTTLRSKFAPATGDIHIADSADFVNRLQALMRACAIAESCNAKLVKSTLDKSLSGLADEIGKLTVQSASADASYEREEKNLRFLKDLSMELSKSIKDVLAIYGTIIAHYKVYSELSDGLQKHLETWNKLGKELVEILKK